MRIYKKTIALHLLFWIFNFWRGLHFTAYPNYKIFFIGQLIIAISCYINYFILIPKLLKRGDIHSFILWLLSFGGIFIISFTSWLYFRHHIFNEVSPWNLKEAITTSYHMSLLFVGMSTASRLTFDWIKNESKTEELLLQKSINNVLLIKSNINLPFILQALTYTENLAKENPKDAEQPIIALSNILRYGLYETQNKFISLSRELEILEEYIEILNQIDSTIKLKINYIPPIDNIPISPNILIRFIGYWKEIISNEVEGEQIINIYAEHKTILINLPITNTPYFSKKLIEKKIPDYTDEYFNVTYFINHDCIILKIINIVE